MAFLFTNLAQAVWRDLGKVAPFHQFKATGGSATTIINTVFNTRDDPPEDNLFLEFTAVVVRDAGGAGASPEGKLQRVSAYVASTATLTVDTTFTDAVGSDDDILLADQDIPLPEMYAICNRALQELGDIANVYSAISLVAGTYEYSLPVAYKRGSPIMVEYDDTLRIVPISDYHIRASTAGSAGTLVFHDPPSGTAYITYRGPHPDLTAYNSPISEYIVPKLAIAAATAHALQWYNGTQAGGNSYWLQRENKAWQDLENARIKYPIWSPPQQTHMFRVGQEMPYIGDQTIYNR